MCGCTELYRTEVQSMQSCNVQEGKQMQMCFKQRKQSPAVERGLNTKGSVDLNWVAVDLSDVTLWVLSVEGTSLRWQASGYICYGFAKVLWLNQYL